MKVLLINPPYVKDLYSKSKLSQATWLLPLNRDRAPIYFPRKNRGSVPILSRT